MLRKGTESESTAYMQLDSSNIDAQEYEADARK